MQAQCGRPLTVLLLFCEMNQQPQVIRENVPASHAISMKEDGEGSVWISYFSGSIVQSQQRPRDHCRDGSEGYWGNLAYLATDTKGRLWISKDAHVGYMPLTERIRRQLHLSGITSIAAARDGIVDHRRFSTVQVFHQRGTDSGGRPLLTSGLRQKRSSCSKMTRGACGDWECDQTGLFRMDAHHNIEAGCDSAGLHHGGFYEDHEGNLWAGTDAGLDRISPCGAGGGAGLGTSCGGVLSVCQALDGSKWAAATDGVLMT